MIREMIAADEFGRFLFTIVLVTVIITAGVVGCQNQDRTYKLEMAKIQCAKDVGNERN